MEVFMVCPACPTIGFVGGILGGYIGINPPKTVQGKCISILTTSSLVSLTVIALKVFAKITICNFAGLTPYGVGLILAKTIPMAIVYSIGVNYLLNRFVYNPPKAKPCCCQET